MMAKGQHDHRDARCMPTKLVQSIFLHVVIVLILSLKNDHPLIASALSPNPNLWRYGTKQHIIQTRRGGNVLHQSSSTTTTTRLTGFGVSNTNKSNVNLITKTRLFSSPNPNHDNDDNKTNIFKRFVSPRIDDPGLPLADSLIAQIVAPTFEVFWLSLNRAPLPTWLTPLSKTLLTTRGALVAPTLIHGAGLASCWIAGALASRAFESESFDVSNGKGYATVLTRVLKAGAFATGLLIFATQLDLFVEFGGRYVQFGESEEIDIRLLSAAVELVNDVFFEAVALLSWRLYRASLTAD